MLPPSQQVPFTVNLLRVRHCSVLYAHPYNIIQEILLNSSILVKRNRLKGLSNLLKNTLRISPSVVNTISLKTSALNHTEHVCVCLPM